MKTTIQIATLCLLILTSCNLQKASSSKMEQPIKKERPLAITNNKFFELDGKEMLYGGTKESEHFDITDCALKNDQFHYGIGRETFPALLNPAFISVQQADSVWADTTRFLLAYSGDEVKAYSVQDLTRHEIVNDVLDGKPIMAAYCILADLGAIYERNYGDNELTFALSGYTYFDKDVWNGLDGFVLWDRETESLWWPLTGNCVSGPLKDVKLKEMSQANWKDVTWKYIKDNYSQAKVLESGQDFERPTTWSNTVNVTDIKSNYTSK